MPIYAYLCDLCGHQQDFLQKLADPRLTTCPACSKEGLKRQLTAAGFQLKGSGWYVTDFRDGGKKPAESASGTPAATGSAESKSGGESKSKESAVSATPSSTPAAAPAPSAAPAPTPSSASSSATSAPTSSKNSTNS
jgi:putative FmdB family regulatory protein